MTSLILLFQIVRNISNIGYVIILFSSYGWLYLTYFFQHKNKSIKYKFVFKPIRLVFLMSIIWIPFISLLNMGNYEYAVALPRYLVTFPYILFCYFYDGYNIFLVKKFLNLFVSFIFISSLTIPTQILFGPISFFTEASIRGGLVRYTSLAGSLTILGTLGGIALAILLFSGRFLFGKNKKKIIIILLILSMLMTLQKAAVVNISICYIFYFLFYGEIGIGRKIISMLTGIIAIFVLFRLFSETEFILYITNLINYTFSSSSIGINNDFFIRIWYLPSRVVAYNNMTLVDFIFGIGFPALAGAMGNPQYPMAHNNYFELLFSGGILHLVSYLYLLLIAPCNAMKRIFKHKKLTNIDRIYSVSIVLILINMMIGAVTFYQPVTAVIVFFMIFSYDKIKNIEFD